MRQAMKPQNGNDVEVARALTHLRRLLIAVVIATATANVVATHTVNAGTTSQSTPVPTIVSAPTK